jgi:hypothetical protein
MRRFVLSQLRWTSLAFHDCHVRIPLEWVPQDDPIYPMLDKALDGGMVVKAVYVNGRVGSLRHHGNHAKLRKFRQFPKFLPKFPLPKFLAKHQNNQLDMKLRKELRKFRKGFRSFLFRRRQEAAVVPAWTRP